MLKAERKWIDWMIRQKNILLFLIVTCLAILARVGGLSFVSADMNDYLLPWAEQFRANSGFSAMRSQIGDYNILYQTLIVLICRLPGSMVYLYKCISIFFDFLLTVFQIYLNQVNEYPQLVMNSPSIWTLFFPGYAYMRLCALITTVLILGLFLYHLLNHKQVIREDPESYLILAAWCTWTCFLFLPSMHERYSYLSDLLLVLLALLSHKYLPYALVAVCISGITYTNYLQDYTLWRVIPYLTPITAGAWFAFTFRILPASLTLDKHCTNQETKEYLP